MAIRAWAQFILNDIKNRYGLLVLYQKMSSPKIDKWIHKMWYIDIDIYYVYAYIYTHTVEYSAIKKLNFCHLGEIGEWD